LLNDKLVPTQVKFETAIGLRLACPQLLPVVDTSKYYLTHLAWQMADHAYADWESLTPKPEVDLPPNQFHFDVQYID